MWVLPRLLSDSMIAGRKADFSALSSSLVVGPADRKGVDGMFAQHSRDCALGCGAGDTGVRP